MSLSPKQKYQLLVKNGAVSKDMAQQEALDALNVLYQQLCSADKRVAPPRGLYLWGKVGRGKTFLMDLFTDCVEPERCLRQHFHHFMASVHRQLTEISGSADPLRVVAKRLSKQYEVLCFDEFFVSDIGDAMLLGSLMQYLFEYNVVLVATSNTAVDRLYWDGLQRARFLPAIASIQEHTNSIHLTGKRDHRTRSLTYKQIYFTESACPIENSKQTEALFKQNELPVRMKADQSLAVLGREIPYLSRNATRICFDFSQLCEGPRSHLDYIKLAEQFQTIIVLGIPQLGGMSYEHIKARGTEDGSTGSGETGERKVVLSSTDDAARRFIALVDELYERKVKLFVSCSVPLVKLYSGGALSFEFERVLSRLTEMASEEYYGMPHSP